MYIFYILFNCFLLHTRYIYIRAADFYSLVDDIPALSLPPKLKVCGVC